MWAKTPEWEEVWRNSQGELGWRAESQVVVCAQSEVRQPDPNGEVAKAPSPPHSQALCDPHMPGLAFIIPKSPAMPVPWGSHPLGEVIATQRSSQSSYHVRGTQLRIITFFPSLPKCQTPIYLE